MTTPWKLPRLYFVAAHYIVLYGTSIFLWSSQLSQLYFLPVPCPVLALLAKRAEWGTDSVWHLHNHYSAIAKPARSVTNPKHSTIQASMKKMNSMPARCNKLAKIVQLAPSTAQKGSNFFTSALCTVLLSVLASKAVTIAGVSLCKHRCRSVQIWQYT